MWKVQIQIPYTELYDYRIHSYITVCDRTLLKKSVLWETQTTSETLSETLFGFREGFRTCKAFSKIPYWFPGIPNSTPVRYSRILFPTVGNPISIFENHKGILGNRFVRKSRLGTQAGFREYLFGFRVISSETRTGSWQESTRKKSEQFPTGILLLVPGISGIFLQDLAGSCGRNLRLGHG